MLSSGYRYYPPPGCEIIGVAGSDELWQSQGKEKEAQQILAEIYGWFTKGFDTADLKEAKALLKGVL